MTTPNPPDPTRTVEHIPEAPPTAAATIHTRVANSEIDGEGNFGAPAVSGYELLAELGRGGMGIVYSARELALGREVAVKTILPELADNPRLAQEFNREVQITARLPHPGVPPVHALGTLHDGRPFLVMKLIRGKTLANILDDRESPTTDLPKLMGIFEGICQAVGFAHSQSVIHRDLKPGNVMVGGFGEVQVMDWGLARELANPDRQRGGESPAQRVGLKTDPIADPQSSPEHTVAGSTKGTPAYMSPEQARGDWVKVDTRADVFSLGGILCAILTGKAPYSGGTVRATLTRAREGNLEEGFARLDSSGTDPELVALCKRSLSPQREDRFADGKALADAVGAYRASVEERAHKAELDRALAEAEAREQRKRRKVQLALALAVGLLLLAGGAFAWWQDSQAEQRKLELFKADARSARAEAEAERQQRIVQERTLRDRAEAAALLDQYEAALRATDKRRALDAHMMISHRVNAGLVLSSSDHHVQLNAEIASWLSAGGDETPRIRWERCERDAAALRTLDWIDNQRWAVANGRRQGSEELESRLVEVLTKYIGWNKTPPDTAAKLINDSLIRERLLMSLEVWFVESGRDPALRAILSAADPDAFRDEARRTNYQFAAVAWGFRGKRIPTDQPVWFAVAHAFDESVPLAAREKLLLGTHQGKPNNLSLLMTMGYLANFEARNSAATRAGWYRAALAVQPENVAAWVNLGVALRDSGDLQGAIAAFRRAIQGDRNYPMAHNNLAVVLAGTNDLDGAIVEFREVVRLNPKLPQGRYNLANALREKGNLDGAIAEYREAVRLAPDLTPALQNLGLALAEKRDFKGAIDVFRQYARVDPKEALAHMTLATFHIELKQFTEALVAARLAVEADPKLAHAHGTLGRALLELGDRHGAKLAWQEAARLDPARYRNTLRLLPPLPVAPAPRERIR